MQDATLKLVQPQAITPVEEERERFRLDRRQIVRREVRGRVTAVCEPASAAGLKKIASLQLRDISHAGLGVVCDERLPIGSTIHLFLPRHLHDAGGNATAEVAYCRRQGQQYSIGLAFIGQIHGQRRA